MSEHTPITEEVVEFIRAADHLIAHRFSGTTDAVDAFYRWLAAHDADQEPNDQIKQLLRDLTDPDDCWFDHNGGCQTHGYLPIGRPCHADVLLEIANTSVTTQEGTQR